MCGIAGCWHDTALSGTDLTAVAEDMAASLHHRGPDDSGAWTDGEKGIALGFRRLAIVDLSPAGHQPMGSGSGRFQIVFNGEIYNHRELAAQLGGRGHRFRGHSDTEVALAAFEEWGIQRAVEKFVGMFSMAVWDKADSSLSLIRDRLGIKPLFVYTAPGLTVFASELKALARHPQFVPAIDSEALGSYFRYLYVPAPHSIYQNVRKLLPGSILRLRYAGDVAVPETYWSLEDVAREGMASPNLSEDEAANQLEGLLKDSIRLRMRADVPVGAFLSGGIDSTTIAALMQEVSNRPAKTFTIGFDAAAHDESSEAARIAEHLGTDHQEVRLSGSDAMDLIPRLPEMYDEPMADPSQLPTYLICAAAREHVTVALSGDGGDELFGGYNRYIHGEPLIRGTARIPWSFRRAVGAGLASVSPGGWDTLGGRLGRLLPTQPQRLVGEKVHKLATLLQQPTPNDMYTSLMSAWQQPPVSGAGHDNRVERIMNDSSLPVLERMMLSDQLIYLPDDMLAKVDRASMAVSLEVRVPLLDHRVVEFSWSIPRHMKIRGGEGKWLLRRVLSRHVPTSLTDRPKTGFSVPLAEWLRGPLRSWAEELLSPDNLADVPGLDSRVVRSTWDGLIAGHNAQQLAIWTVLMLQSWRERWSTVPA